MFMEDFFRRAFAYSTLRTVKDKADEAQPGCGGFHHNFGKFSRPTALAMVGVSPTTFVCFAPTIGSVAFWLT
jgi:hypothetical protein